MVNKNKNTKTTHNAETITHALPARMSIAVMAAAFALNVVHLGEHLPMMALAHASTAQADAHSGQSGEHSRSGREEIRHSTASYGVIRLSEAVPGTL